MSDTANELLEWARTQQPVLVATLFCVSNIIACSVFPVPVGFWMMIMAGVLYGQVLGLTLYLSTSVIGAWITFLLVRLVRQQTWVTERC